MNSRTKHPAGGERGMALVMALLILLVASVLAGVLMMNLQVESKITSHGLRQSAAFNNAQAGVAEMLGQIRAMNAQNDPTNPNLVSKVFMVPVGSVPAVGANTIGLPTGQPAGQWLNYSTATDGADVLTATYKPNAAGTAILRYDPTKTPPINDLTGYPIFRITSTGRDGGDRRRIVTEVIQKPVTARANAALTAQVGIKFSGTANVCGYNHDMNTPWSTQGAHVGPCTAWELASGHLPGGWSENGISKTGSSNPAGVPGYKSEYQTGFYAGPWEVLDMAQAEFFSWIGPPISAVPANPTGIYYIDDDGTAQNQSAAIHLNGGTGEGLLYIDGDCHINGNFMFKGLIYVEGDFQVNGTCWILGGIIVKGISEIKVANGTCDILYSRDAIEQNISRYGGQFVTLSWLESN